MIENFTISIGIIAALFTTFAFIPQALKIYKSKSTKDISLTMWLVFSVGVVLWLVYGILIMSFPIIIANIVTLFISLFILFYKIKYS